MIWRTVGLFVLSMILYVAGYQVMPRGPMYRQLIGGWLVTLGWFVLLEAWR